MKITVSCYSYACSCLGGYSLQVVREHEIPYMEFNQRWQEARKYVDVSSETSLCSVKLHMCESTFLHAETSFSMRTGFMVSSQLIRRLRLQPCLVNTDLPPNVPTDFEPTSLRIQFRVIGNTVRHVFQGSSAKTYTLLTKIKFRFNLKNRHL